MIPRPDRGRIYAKTRPVRLGDVMPTGRVRLDAIARYLQDIGNDDANEAIGADAMAWVIRKTTIEVSCWPVFGEVLSLTTWAGGMGSRWAERRTSVAGNRGAAVEASATLIHVDMMSGRPRKLLPSFLEVYGEAAGGREIDARLSHAPAPPDAVAMPWYPRVTDLDVLGHVNNAVYWGMVEEHLEVHEPFEGTVEYRGGIAAGHPVEILRSDDALWVFAAGTLAASVTITTPR